jgi:polyhydroxybutyrate depolymerase
MCFRLTFALFSVAAMALIGCGRVGELASKPAPASPASGQRGVFAAETVKVGKTTREYRLYVPQKADPSKSVPLLFAFHGYLIDSKDVMPVYTKLDETAEKHGFLLVYPNALERNWALSPKKMVDDIAFFDALLKKLQADYAIDPDRIYTVGMSNGGYMAQWVGIRRSKVVAAVASHSGALGVQSLRRIGAARKYPVMIIHGNQDRILSIDVAHENRDKYKREGHEVNCVEIDGLGHAWATEQNINEKIWSFFEKHPLR